MKSVHYQSSKYCSSTYVKEGIADPSKNYDGSPLIQCPNCLITHYKDRNALRSCWKKHNPYCKPLSRQDIEFMDGLGPMEAIQMFEKCIHPNTNERRLVGHALVYLLQHFLKLFQRVERGRREQDDEEDEEEEDPQGDDDTNYNTMMMMMMRDVELQLHGICRAIIFHSTCIQGIIHMPGMCNYLFTTGHDILLSDQARFVKKHLNGYCSTSSSRLEPPTQEYINASIIDPLEKDRVNAAIIKLSALSTNKNPSCMQYCYGHYNLLIAAAVEGIPSHVSSNDGRGRLRLGKNDDTNLTIIAIRECLSLWTDPFIRASCGDAMAPAASLALTAIEEFTNEECDYLDELHGAEIAPGLDIDKAIVTCLMVIKEKALNVDYAIQVLVLVARSKKCITKPLWSGISLERRAVVFLAIIDFINDNWTERTFIFEVLTKLLSQSSDHLEIWERAAEDELLGPRRPGMNISLRAIAHHFIRTHTIEDGIHMVEAIAKVKSISLRFERNARTRKEKILLSEMRTCKELAERIINI